MIPYKQPNIQSMYQTKCQTKTPTNSFEEAKQAARKKGKSFCKVCFDAGKPDHEYTSHYVKSAPGPNGKLVCPTLLNQSCLTCGQTGHTSGYCTQRQNPVESRPVEQRIQPIVLSRNVSSVSAEAELRLMSATFKPKHDDFPSLTQQEPQEDQEPQEPQQAQQPQQPAHVYNPRSNAFGALAQKQPKQPKQPNQKSFQPPHQQEARPMTMAERLKNPPPPPPAVKPTSNAATPAVKPMQVKFADMPPKSQFWWQDEV
jgi:hypothetical protein